MSFPLLIKCDRCGWVESIKRTYLEYGKQYDSNYGEYEYCSGAQCKICGYYFREEILSLKKKCEDYDIKTSGFLTGIFAGLLIGFVVALFYISFSTPPEERTLLQNLLVAFTCICFIMFVVTLIQSENVERGYKPKRLNKEFKKQYKLQKNKIEFEQFKSEWQNKPFEERQIEEHKLRKEKMIKLFKEPKL